MERWNLFLNFSTNRKHVIAPMHVVVPLSTLGAMLITIIYKSAFSMMKVHKSTCLFIPSKITLITITYLPMFIRLVFFLNKGFLQYNRVAKTVNLRILYSFMKWLQKAISYLPWMMTSALYCELGKVFILDISIYMYRSSGVLNRGPGVLL